MKFLSLYRVELRRLLLSKAVLATAILSMLSLPLGNILYVFYNSRVMSDRYILTPVLTGTAVGAVLWAAITIMEADSLHRSGVHILTDTISQPALLSAAKTLALLTISMFTVILITFVYLPYTAVKMSYLFSAGTYFASFIVFMLPTWWISILFAGAVYQTAQRVELAVILYILLAGISISGIADSNYFLRWLNPFVHSFSDGFPSAWPLRIGLYTRLIWICIALGVWLFSMLCVRKYQRGLLFSFIFSFVHKFSSSFSLLLAGAAFVLIGAALWHFQPFIDHGPDKYVYTDNDIVEIDDSNQMNAIDYTLTVNPALGTISVVAKYDIQVPYDETSVLQLNPGYKITSMTYDGENVPFWTVDDDINGKRPTYFELPKNVCGKTLVIEYSGFPTQANYSARSLVNCTVDYDYISLALTAVFPILENYYMPKGCNAFAKITIPENLIPFYNYIKMTDFVDNGDGTRTWKTISPEYIGNFTAGNYCISTFFIDELEVDFAYGEAYRDIVEEHHIQQTIIDILTYCSEHYGELWSANNNHLLLRQESSMYGGGYAVRGVSTWFETVLAPDTLNNPDKGASATEVFIHEMIHQWWGGLGLNCTNEPLWSEEGLTVYHLPPSQRKIWSALRTAVLCRRVEESGGGTKSQFLQPSPGVFRTASTNLSGSDQCVQLGHKPLLPDAPDDSESRITCGRRRKNGRDSASDVC